MFVLKCIIIILIVQILNVENYIFFVYAPQF